MHLLTSKCDILVRLLYINNIYGHMGLQPICELDARWV